eukprot:GHVU01027584.1.p1 GENE.GHVU01027584.1~~GHVU01027584.1.p1  ORF type:complete len:159 (-),score=10.76 GHVU01027584.1:218-694(-)
MSGERRRGVGMNAAIGRQGGRDNMDMLLRMAYVHQVLRTQSSQAVRRGTQHNWRAAEEHVRHVCLTLELEAQDRAVRAEAALPLPLSSTTTPRRTTPHMIAKSTETQHRSGKRTVFTDLVATMETHWGRLRRRSHSHLDMANQPPVAAITIRTIPSEH